MVDKLKISPELRWKAHVRQQARAVFDLFHFGSYRTKSESGLGISGRKNISMRLKKDPNINVIAGKAKVLDLWKKDERGVQHRPSAQVFLKPGTVEVPEVRLDNRESMHPMERNRLFESSWHELMHLKFEDKLNRNDFVLAHAVGNYMFAARDPHYGPPIASPEKFKLIENAFVKGSRESVVRRYGQDYENAEYGIAYPRGESFAHLGRVLALRAQELEAKLGVPGIGLIFIREVSRGGSIDENVAKVNRRKKQYTLELAHWFKRHPSVKRYVLNPVNPFALEMAKLKRQRAVNTMKKKINSVSRRVKKR